VTNPGPLPAGGQSFTLPTSGEAVLLTETAVQGGGLQVINTSVGDLAYLGNSSGVSPTSGVPLEAGTALPWIAGGEVWAAAAPGSTNPITVVITSAIAGWEPSPAAVASAVAAALLEQGIPNVLVEDIVVSNLSVPVGATTANFPVAGYASLVVFPSALVARVVATQLDTAGNQVDIELVSSARHATRIAVTGATVNFQNLGATPVTLWVVGSNRPALARVDSRAKALNGDVWSAPTAAYTANQVVALVQTDPDVELQGQCYLEYHVNSTGATVEGTLFLNKNDGGSYRLALASELVLATANQLCVRTMVAITPGYNLQWVCTVAGTASIVATLVPCQV
jgi:hypothetical protein